MIIKLKNKFKSFLIIKNRIEQPKISSKEKKNYSVNNWIRRTGHNKTKKREWIDNTESIKKLQYQSYKEYLEHQASKLNIIDLSKYDIEYRKILKTRISEIDLLIKGKSILCLAARIGTECKAFQELGAFAIGIDLNPGESNQYVLPGDFHNLQFANESVDYIFTNSLDHAFNLEKVIGEVLRVLKPEGKFITEIMKGSDDNNGNKPGSYESLWWSKNADVIDNIVNLGLEVKYIKDFSLPWSGSIVIFEKC